MTDSEIRAIICDVLGRIAPEADLDTIDPTAQLQEEIDLDSMNFLEFVTGIHQRTGIDIPERDYPLVATLDGCIEYLRSRVGAPV